MSLINTLKTALLDAKAGDELGMLSRLISYYEEKNMPISKAVRERLYQILVKEGLPYRIKQDIYFTFGENNNFCSVTALISANYHIERLLKLKEKDY